jgi:hypothetical protein
MENKKYIRNCPTCNTELTYSSIQSLYNAKRRNTGCYKCRDFKKWNDPLFLEKKHKINESYKVKYSGNGNPFYGKKHTQKTIDSIKSHAKCLYGTDNLSYGKSVYQWWIEKYGIDIANQKMKETKIKLSLSSSGENNPMYGKPSPQGSGNGWSGWYNGWYFRSLRELSYMINVIEKNEWTWEPGEQRKYKISYTDWNGKTRNYFPDFVVNGNMMIECKPRKLHNSIGVIAKKNAAEIFCQINRMTYNLIDVDILDSSTIKILHDSKKMIFLEKYEEKYKIYEKGNK